MSALLSGEIIVSVRKSTATPVSSLSNGLRHLQHLLAPPLLGDEGRLRWGAGVQGRLHGDRPACGDGGDGDGDVRGDSDVYGHGGDDHVCGEGGIDESGLHLSNHTLHCNYLFETPM